MKANKSSKVKNESLINISSIERLFELADQKKSVWWTKRRMLWSAAFFQNWNARQLSRWIKDGSIKEVK